jgi:O-antigen ligase
MVALGGILVVLEKMLGMDQPRSSRDDNRQRRVEQDGEREISEGHDVRAGKKGWGLQAWSDVRRGLGPDLRVWLVAGPIAILGIWSAVMSSHPAHSLQGIIMMATYLGFFYLVLVTVRTREHQRILVWVVVFTAAFLALVGLLKLFDILVFPWWDYTAELREGHGATRLSGVYVGSNHMAGFLEMSIPMLLGLFLTRSRPLEVRVGMICLAMFLIICLVLTLSRGGWAGMAGAMFFMAMVLLFKKGFAHKRLVGTLLAMVIVTALIVLASTPVVDRITTLTQGEVEDNLAGRLTYWAGTRAMIRDNFWAGTGPGTFTVAFPPYQVPGLPVLPRYAHGDYLEFAAEAGIFVVPVMLWILFLFFRAGFTRLKSRSRQTMGFSLGAMSAMVAILIHSIGEGNFQIPANIILFTAIMGTALRDWH